MKNDQINIIVAGLSGQGVIMFSKVLTSVFAKTQYTVSTYEVLGTAHRGTLIFSHIRIGKNKWFSNLIPAGGGDMIIGFEPLETLRLGSYYLADGGHVIMNNRKIIPVYASVGRDFTSSQPRPLGYPSLDYINDYFLDMEVKTLDLNATGLAIEAGHYSATNMVLMGAMMGTGLIPTTVESIKSTIERLVPPGTVEVNLRAFDKGLEFYANAAEHAV